MKRSLNMASMNLRVGIFVAVTVCIIVIAVLFPIRGLPLISDKMELAGEFNDAGGLKRNSPVSMVGMEIGTVKSVKFNPEGSAHRIRVVISVDRKINHLIRSDSVMHIVGQGLLGDKFVEITPGDKLMAQVAEGQTLVTEEPKDMMADLEPIKEKVNSVLAKAESLLAQAQSREGTVGSLFMERKLYDELVGAMTGIKNAANDLHQISSTINEKLLDKNTKEGVDSTVAAAKRVAVRMDQYTEKVERIKWYLDLAGSKYEGAQFETSAHLRVVPNEDRYYMFGIGYFNAINKGEGDLMAYTGTEDLTYDGALGFRVLQTPIFFWGGVKRSYFATGLDLRLFQERVGLSADLYQFIRDTPQMDLAARWRFFNVFNLVAGVDNTLVQARYHGGLMFTYDDQDLTGILIKIKSGL